MSAAPEWFTAYMAKNEAEMAKMRESLSSLSGSAKESKPAAAAPKQAEVAPKVNTWYPSVAKFEDPAGPRTLCQAGRPPKFFTDQDTESLIEFLWKRFCHFKNTGEFDPRGVPLDGDYMFVPGFYNSDGKPVPGSGFRVAIKELKERYGSHEPARKVRKVELKTEKPDVDLTEDEPVPSSAAPAPVVPLAAAAPVAAAPVAAAPVVPKPSLAAAMAAADQALAQMAAAPSAAPALSAATSALLETLPKIPLRALAEAAAVQPESEDLDDTKDADGDEASQDDEDLDEDAVKLLPTPLRYLYKFGDEQNMKFSDVKDLVSDVVNEIDEKELKGKDAVEHIKSFVEEQEFDEEAVERLANYIMKNLKSFKKLIDEDNM